MKIIVFHSKQEEKKTDNLTEYYNLIYEYKNDCITASINTIKITIQVEISNRLKNLFLI